MSLASLLVLNGAAAGRDFSLGSATRIGSAAECECQLNLEGISSDHARIEITGNTVSLSSALGVYVDGRPAQQATLATFAFIDVAGVTLLFQKLGCGYVSASTIHQPATNLPPLVRKRSVHELVKLDRQRVSVATLMLDEDRLLVIGGADPMRSEPRAALEVISLSERHRRELPLLVARVACSAVRLLDGRVLIARAEPWELPPSGAPHPMPEVVRWAEDSLPGPRAAVNGQVHFSSCLQAAGRGLRHVDFIHAVDAETTSLALLRGSAGYSGDFVADICRWTLAELLNSDSYGPRLPKVLRKPPLPARNYAGHWTSFLLDRSPLPTNPQAALDALAERLHGLLEAMNAADPNMGAGAEGILALVSGDRMHVVRRGIARVVRVRGNVLETVLFEHSLAREAEAPTKGLPAHFRNIPVSMFGLASSPTSAVELTLEPGDRFVLLSGEALGAPEPALTQALLDPSGSALTQLLSELHEDSDQGFGTVGLQILGTAKA